MPKELGSPFYFPLAGQSQVYRRAAISTTVGNSSTIFTSAVGTSGVVRTIHIAFTMNAATAQASIEAFLDAYFDGAGSADWSIPLGTLMGMEPVATAGGTRIGMSYTNRFVEVPYPIVTAGPTINGNVTLSTTFPIPFPNGLTLKVRSSVGTITTYTNVEYQNVLPACWNRNLRPIWSRSNESTAKVANVAKTFSWTDTTTVLGVATAFDSTYIGKSIYGNGTGGNLLLTSPGSFGEDMLITAAPTVTQLTTSAGCAYNVALTNTTNTAYRLCTPHEFVTRAAGKRGYVAMVIGAVTNTSDGNDPYEGNVRFFTDNTVEPTHVWTGTEDFFGSGFYWNAGTSRQGLDYGLTQYEGDGAGRMGAYRIFPAGVRYTNGCRGTYTNVATIANTTNNWSTLVYEET